MMSFIIEQDQDQTRNSFSLHSRADFAQLRLAEAKLWSRQRFDDLRLPILFLIKYNPGNVDIRDDSLILDLQFIFEARDSSDEKLEVVVIECTFRAEYTLEHDYKPTAEEVAAFHSGNAVFNGWPYFRAYVQDSVTRMSLPAPGIPFLRLQSKPPARTGPQANVAVPEGVPAAGRKRKATKRR